MKKKRQWKIKKMKDAALSNENQTKDVLKSVPFDPSGMWTGYPADPDVYPDQDADDL